MRTLWLWLPDEALVLVIAAIGLALMVRLISGRAAATLLGTIVLLVLAGPFVEALFEVLPAWVSLLILLALAIWVLRALAGLLIGQRAADHMVGILAADVVRILFALMFLPFRIVGWLVRRA
jgi:hypothetical protein